MLSSPVEVVVGATDAPATLSFLAAFGFDEADRRDVDSAESKARYGLEHDTQTFTVQQAGRSVGAIRVVSTRRPAPVRTPFDRGPLALDVYARDVDEAAAIADASGWDRGPVGTIELGPLVMRQVEVTAPDGWRFVLVESDRRRPCLLDNDPDAPFSEVHSLLWSVDQIEAENCPLIKAGLIEQHLFPVGLPSVAAIMRLPRVQHDLRMNLLTDASQRPIRLELFEFSGDPGPDRPTWPLAGGLGWPVFEVEDMDEVIDAMDLIHVTAALTDDGVVITGTVNNLRVELRTA